MLRHAHNLSSERLRQNELQFSVNLGYVVKMGLERGRWWGWGAEKEGRIKCLLWYGLIILIIYRTSLSDSTMHRVSSILATAHPY